MQKDEAIRKLLQAQQSIAEVQMEYINTGQTRKDKHSWQLMT
jgi:hypothetical protein